MTVVGWLADRPAYVGGAERTQAEFRAAAPKGVEIVDCPPGKVDPDCDRYAIHNSITYSLKDLQRTGGKPTFRYWNDVGNLYPEELRAWQVSQPVTICCSKLQARHMNVDADALIPPPVNLELFERAAVSMNGDRRGVCCVAQWRSVNKGAHLVAGWAQREGVVVDFYGGGAFAPPGSREVAYRGLPGLLARYDRFVFIPAVVEPFGRAVAEAWAAGCLVVCNELVGALEWLRDGGARIRCAGEDYWRLVLGDD